ncbi:ankyrin repeat-containing domain protein [Lasiosphaeria ovina]|uniref:Ankyrin repeat-containing domain protein n=1 Tax=Lasiosphaeria ovina TaxID=92902 RepID=A0AAE0NB01_9PEZI|nr:ankyrin repeat-containing domain protein [Lasiosphaeria ovina]
MELAAAAFGLVGVTGRASSKLWKLCDSWRDAPREVHQLRDNLVRASDFFSQVKSGVERTSNSNSTPNAHQKESLRQLKLLLDQGFALIVDIETIIQKLSDGQPSSENTDQAHSETHDPLSKRRKIAWLANAKKLRRLGASLKEISVKICASLIHLNVIISMDLVPTLAVSQEAIIERITETESRLSEHLDESTEGVVSSIEQRLGVITNQITTRIEERLDTMSSQITSRIDRSVSEIEHLDSSRHVGARPVAGTNRERQLASQNQEVALMDRLLGSPELLLRVYRTIPIDSATIQSSIFGCVRLSDINGAKCLLREGRGSVYDVRADNKITPLVTAISMQKIEFVRFLLQAGSDPFHNDSLGQPMPILAAMRQFEESGGEIGRQLAELLPVEQLVQDEEMYTTLHKIVLGLLPLDLEAELEKAPIRADLNTGSWTANTPLHLAVMRGKTHMAVLLLKAGADVTARGNRHKSALHMACRNGKIEIAKMLIESGADVNARDINGLAPLHICEGGLGMVSLLLYHGADVRALCNDCLEPLGTAAHYGSTAVINCLLDNGADINHRDWEGDIPLFESVKMKHQEATRALLSRSSDYTSINNHGRGFLHHLAVTGDVEMFRIFTQVRMRGVDVRRMDNRGKTPRQLFIERPGLDETPESLALRSAFDELLASVTLEPDLGSEEEEEEKLSHDSEDDEFFDIEES